MKHKGMRLICLSLFASVSLQASSLKESVEKVLSTNPEVIAEKKTKKLLKSILMKERQSIYQDWILMVD